MPPTRLLAVCAATTLATGAAAQNDPPAETLLDATPDSLRTANYVLSKTFERGAKDMDAYVLLARLLLQHALGLAEQNPDQAPDYRRAALPISYNLAANTWPGWEADAPPVSDHNRRLGLEAAYMDVKLTAETAPTDQRRANSLWILGAHLLAEGAYDIAVAIFEAGRADASAAGLEQSATMAQGWIHLANTLAGTDETAELDAIKAELIEQGDDGAFYAAQYATALEVFTAAR